MKQSKKVQVDVDCERLGIENYPIDGYPFTYYKENYVKRPYHHDRERKVRSPSTPIHVEAYSTPVGMYSVPRYRLNYVDQYMNVPVVQKVAKVVEIPEVREITKYVDVVKIVDVPVEQVRMIPKLKVRNIEKIRHVPGPVEYIDVPQEFIVHKAKKEIVEKIHEVPVIEDVEIEVPFYVPTPVGPPEEIRIEVPLPYDVPQFCYRPERTFPAHMPVDVRHITNESLHRWPTHESDEKEYVETHLSTVNSTRKNLPFLYSSPVLGGYTVNENRYKQNFKNGTKDDDRLDEVLYSYNRSHTEKKPVINVAPNTASYRKKHYAMNNVNRYEKCCDDPQKKKHGYKVTVDGECPHNLERNTVGTYSNNRYTSPKKFYDNIPVSADQYYYTYSSKNGEKENCNNYYTNEETQFIRDQQISNDMYSNQERNAVNQEYIEYNEENEREYVNKYDAQKQIDNNFNMGYENEENYYGDENNYIYKNEEMREASGSKSKRQVAELIVKRSDRILRFYHPANNRKIEKYFKDNEVRFTCEEDSYMKLDEFVRLVEKLKRSNPDENISENITHSSHKMDVIDLTGGTDSFDSFQKSNVNLFSMERRAAAHSYSLLGMNSVNVNKKKQDFFNSPEDKNSYNEFTVNDNGSHNNMQKKLLSNEYVTNTYNIPKNAKINNSTKNPIHVEPNIFLNNKDKITLNSLLECRNALAKSLQIQDPEQFISTHNLKMIILHNPKTLEELRNLQLRGFSEEHIKNYGFEFLAIIQSYNCE